MIFSLAYSLQTLQLKSYPEFLPEVAPAISVSVTLPSNLQEKYVVVVDLVAKRGLGEYYTYINPSSRGIGVPESGKKSVSVILPLPYGLALSNDVFELHAYYVSSDEVSAPVTVTKPQYLSKDLKWNRSAQSAAQCIASSLGYELSIQQFGPRLFTIAHDLGDNPYNFNIFRVSMRNFSSFTTISQLRSLLEYLYNGMPLPVQIILDIPLVGDPNNVIPAAAFFDVFHDRPQFIFNVAWRRSSAAVDKQILDTVKSIRSHRLKNPILVPSSMLLSNSFGGSNTVAKDINGTSGIILNHQITFKSSQNQSCTLEPSIASLNSLTSSAKKNSLQLMANRVTVDPSAACSALVSQFANQYFRTESSTWKGWVWHSGTQLDYLSSYRICREVKFDEQIGITSSTSGSTYALIAICFSLTALIICLSGIGLWYQIRKRRAAEEYPVDFSDYEEKPFNTETLRDTLRLPKPDAKRGRYEEPPTIEFVQRRTSLTSNNNNRDLST